jgi:hypothetical protein
MSARSDHAIQTEQPGDYGSKFAEHWSAKCSTFLARSITATGPFVLDVTLSKMRRRSTNHAFTHSTCLHRCHEMAVIRSRIWSSSAGNRPTGADHEEIDERAALCCAKKGGQDQGQARARQVGHGGGARASSRNGAAVCGPFNDAPSYRAAEAPIGREVQREVLSTTIVITNTIVQVLNSSMLASLSSQRRD